jgi:prepilin-type N-terminal cleavage/methylation domain-containing protein
MPFPQRSVPRRHHGFSMVELMTVLTIIVILVTILIPVVGRVRRAAWEASVKAQINAIDAAVQRYQQDFSAYPGPVPLRLMYPGAGPGNAGEWVHYPAGTRRSDITGAENLVLGLLGGLKPSTAGPGFEFDPTLVGRGPRNLNPLNPKSYQPYIEGLPLSQAGANYSDGAGKSADSPIPEILDRFPGPMPILYLRANVGANGVVSIGGSDDGGSVFPATTPPTPTQYDLNEIIPYTKYFATFGSIGEGKSIKVNDYKNPPAGVTVAADALPHGIQTVRRSMTMDKSAGANYSYPYDAFPYFNNRAIPPTDPTAGAQNRTGTARNKDKFILISAGVDRVYGTADDITNFGSVLE